MLSDASVNCPVRKLLSSTFLLAALVCGAATAHAQDGTTQVTVKPPQNQPTQTTDTDDAEEEASGAVAVVEPVYKNYKGVTIGMSADEARDKLGDPKTKSKTQDFFSIEDDEMATLYYDAAGKVNAISILYTGKNAPKDSVILGETVAPDARGRVHKLIRYPNAGFWVAYSRSVGDSPVVSITMKKLRAPATPTPKQ